MDDVGNETPGLRFVWEQTERRIELQIRQADALDTKAGVVLGIHVLAAGLVASVIPDVAGASSLLVLLVLAGLVVSGSLALHAYRAQRYDQRPAPAELWRFAGWDEDQIRLRFLSTRFEAIEANRRTLRHKARRINGSLWITWVVALAVAVVAAIEGIA